MCRYMDMDRYEHGQRHRCRYRNKVRFYTDKLLDFIKTFLNPLYLGSTDFRVF